jgi:type II secretory pathway component PulM
MSKVVTATTLADLSSAAGAGNAVAYFWASWAPMCSQTEQIFQRLSEQCQNLAFVKIEAEAAEVCPKTLNN